jgi:hypothetical protein
MRTLGLAAAIEPPPLKELTMTLNAPSTPAAIPSAKRTRDAQNPRPMLANGAPATVTVQVGSQITAPGGNIPPGTTFQQGQWAISSDNVYALVLQYDGNLVLYQVIGAPPSPGSSFVGYAMWAASTSSGYTFAVQNDGNLVVYDVNKTPIWATMTNGIQPKCLSVQTDGNLVLYDVNGQPRWATGTNLNLAALIPTLTQGATGRFDGPLDFGWVNLDNEGDQGFTPTVVTLNATTLLITGGYSYDHNSIGSGNGSISIGLTLTGAITCQVSMTWGGTFFNPPVIVNTTGTWYVPSGTDVLAIQVNLDDGNSFLLSAFDETILWYQGIEIAFANLQRVIFENMSGTSSLARSKDARAPRPAPTRAKAGA